MSSGPCSARRGVITGYVVKLLRESTGRSQESFAEELGIDRGTVQGWESSRRPFTAVSVAQSLNIRHQLRRMGADPALCGAINHAAPEKG